MTPLTHTHLQQGLDSVKAGGVDEGGRRWTLAGRESKRGGGGGEEEGREGGGGEERADASYCWNAVATRDRKEEAGGEGGGRGVLFA